MHVTDSNMLLQKHRSLTVEHVVAQHERWIQCSFLVCLWHLCQLSYSSASACWTALAWWGTLPLDGAGVPLAAGGGGLQHEKPYVSV